MIFFDEMDKVLPNDDEEYYTDRSKTILTQLLTLIDGMDSAGNIVFVATCNDYDALPETLTRPGRLDKKIGIGSPTYSSRVEILKMYAQKSSCRFEMTMEDMAKLCVGFSCAALETLVNECILQSDEDGVVSENLIRERFFEIKNEDIPRERSTVDDTVRACRNVGAFIVAKTFNSGHYVLSLDADSVCNDLFNGVISEFDDDYEEDDYDDEYEDDYNDSEDESVVSSSYYSKSDLTNTITVLIGGYVAEEVILHKVYDNVSSYLSLVDDILLSMAKNGMFGLELRYSEYRHENLPYLSDRLEKLNHVFDETIKDCYERAKAILEKNEALIKKLIPYLVEKQILQAEECEKLLAEWGGLRYE
jgi:ATP-dependent Zn protease